MSVQNRVLNLYRENEFVPNDVSQLRLGRIVGMEQKGLLDDKTDEEILALLNPANKEQQEIDEKRLAELNLRKSRY